MEKASETALKARHIFLPSRVRQYQVSQESEATMSEREQKALVIAATSKIKKLGNIWAVPAQ